MCVPVPVCVRGRASERKVYMRVCAVWLHRSADEVALPQRGSEVERER